MIQSHLYAKNAKTRIFDSPADVGEPIFILQKGNWLGVIERQGEWIKVIGVDCEGWVKAEDIEEKSPFSLHALWEQGRPIEYVNS